MFNGVDSLVNRKLRKTAPGTSEALLQEPNCFPVLYGVMKFFGRGLANIATYVEHKNFICQIDFL